MERRQETGNLIVWTYSGGSSEHAGKCKEKQDASRHLYPPFAYKLINKYVLRCIWSIAEVRIYMCIYIYIWNYIVSDDLRNKIRENTKLLSHIYKT